MWDLGIGSWLLILSASGGLVCGEPDYSARSWQAENGLPQAVVNSVIQTRDGYIWVGTYNGLARFDGVRFKVFSAFDTPELQSDDVSILYQDRSGVLWIGTMSGGLTSYAQGRFQFHAHPPELAQAEVRSIAEDPTGRLYVAAGTNLFVRAGKEFVRSPATARFDGGKILHVNLDSVGRPWIAVRGFGFNALDETNAPPQLNYPDIDALTKDASGAFWFGVHAVGLVCMRDGQETHYPEFRQRHVRAVFAARNGDVWVGTQYAGLFRLRDGMWSNFTRASGLSSDAIVSIAEDNEGQIWVGTDGGGLNCLHERKIKTFSVNDGLSANDAATIIEDRAGRIWVGTYGRGISIRDGARFRSFTPPGLDRINAAVLTLCERRDGSIWIGATGEFPMRWDGRTLWPLKDAKLNASVLMEDRKGVLWIGTSQDGVFSLRGDAVTAIQTGHGLSDDRITSIVEDHSGVIWIGTSRGLNRIEHCRVTSQYFTQHGLGVNAIQTLFVDSRGILWIGTAGGGLSQLQDDTVRTISTDEGLPNNVIAQILEDDHGYFWIGSNHGIFQVKRDDLIATFEGRNSFVYGATYGKSDGMLNLECAGRVQPNCLKAKDGRLWFCTVGGAVVIDPQAVSPNPVPPPVYVESVTIDDVKHDLLPRDPEGKGGTRLASATEPGSSYEPTFEVPAGTERLEIQYTGLNFVAPEKVRFRYKLEGIDSAWHDAGSQREVAYNYLAPGKYQFRVIACNNSGVWNETGATLGLIVRPFWWQTTWFTAAALLFAVSAAIWIVRAVSLRKVHRRVAALEHQHAIEEERARIAQNMHDDLGARLTQISLLSGVARLSQDQPAELGEQLAKIGATARETIQALEEVIWAVDPVNDSVEKLLGFIAQFAEAYLQAAGLRCRIEESITEPELPLASELRHHLYLSVKEAMNNIVKHSGATEVRLQTSCADGLLLIQIEDNGRGFDLNLTRPSGRGLKSIRQRIHSIGGEVEIITSSGTGTKLRIHIPLRSGS